MGGLRVVPLPCWKPGRKQEKGQNACDAPKEQSHALTRSEAEGQFAQERMGVFPRLHPHLTMSYRLGA